MSGPRRTGGRLAGIDWGRLAAGSLVGYVGIYLAWLAFGGSDDETRTIVSDVAVLPVGLASTLFALRASQQPGLHSGVRRAWRRLAIGFGAFAVGDLAWCILEAVLGLEPFPSVADLGYVAFYPLVLWGLLSFPMAIRTRADRLKFWLDASIVAVGAGSAIWYFVLLPILLQSSEDPVAVVVALGYPVGDLLLLLGIATVLLRRPGPDTVGALRLLAAGLSLMVVSDVAFGPLVLQDSYQGGGWVDVSWTLAGLLLALAGHTQAARGRRAVPSPDEQDAGVRPFSPIPYLAIALGQVLLLVAALGEWHRALGGLVLAAALVTALVVTRQIVAVRETVRLEAAHAARRESLLRLSQRFGAHVVPGELEAQVLQAAVELVGGDDAVISNWDAERSCLDLAHGLRSERDGAVLGLITQASADAARRADVAFASTEHMPPAGAESLPAVGSGPTVKVSSVIAVPVAHDGQLFGVLAISETGDRRRFSDDDAEILSLLAGIAAAATLGRERAHLEGALAAARTAEHELNNQLTAAAGFAELIASDETAPDACRALAQEALTGALAAARLVGEIRQIRRVVLKGGAVTNATVIDLEHSAA